ncbi:MAG TPA: phospholipase D family protein [Gammaproteobacteria bacterium]|nr:phospholipase D family protein [Gammaproteobacteria bacterium]
MLGLKTMKISTIRHVIVTLLFAAVLLLSEGCSSVFVPYEVGNRTKEKSYSGGGTTLARLFYAVNTAHPELSGAYLLDKGEESLLWRGVLTEQAEKSIDIQTFIWSDDNVGTIGAARLLQAAKRGVRVRVLLDYVTLDVDSDYLVWLNDHPNITIRLYNPFSQLDASIGSKVSTLLSSFSRLNRRMHNKLFLVDGRVVLLGGRNNADEYYDMHADMNFRDRDLLVVGDVLQEARRGFDEYWNSEWSISIDQVLPRKVDLQQRTAYYRKLESYARDQKNYPPRFDDALKRIRESLQRLPGRLSWGKAEMIYDIPGKNEQLSSLRGYGKSGEFLSRSILEAEQEILVETPYMITMPGTLDIFTRLQEQGVLVRVLTDSMASAEDDLVFSAYKRQRRNILRRGVKICELRRDADLRDTVFERFQNMEEMPGISLHAKTAVIDRRTLLIGSFNLDPRSTHINTEHVFRIESPELAEQVAKIINTDMDLENCWQINMDAEGKLTWKTLRDGREDISHIEPDVTFFERMRLLFFMMLPVEAIL